MENEFNFSDVLASLNSSIESSVSSECIIDTMKSYCESWNTKDTELRASLFDEEVEFSDPKNSQKILGITALKSFWEGSQNMPGSIDTVFHECVACGNSGLLDFTITFTNPDSTMVFLKVRDVFEFNSKGKVIRLEAYWDLRSIT